MVGSVNPRASGMRRLETGLLLRAYSAGLFPMADTREADDVFWVEPRRRGIVPLDGFHLSRSLAKVLKQDRFAHSRDLAFDAVIRSCAQDVPGRQQSWINATVVDAYSRLHAEGHAHSIETWDAEGQLVGGLYGVRIGAAFFGESMFSRATDASKAALAHLVARLRFGNFRLLDTQFLTAHLASFGGREVKRARYLGILDDAIALHASWTAFDEGRPQPAPFAPPSGREEGGAAAGVAGAAPAGLAPTGLVLPRLDAEGTGGPSGKRIVQLLSQTS